MFLTGNTPTHFGGSFSSQQCFIESLCYPPPNHPDSAGGTWIRWKGSYGGLGGGKVPLETLQWKTQQKTKCAHKIWVFFFIFLFRIFVTHTDDYHQHDYFVVSFPICCKFKCVFKHAVSSGFLGSLFSARLNLVRCQIVLNHIGCWMHSFHDETVSPAPRLPKLTTTQQGQTGNACVSFHHLIYWCTLDSCLSTFNHLLKQKQENMFVIVSALENILGFLSYKL